MEVPPPPKAKQYLTAEDMKDGRCSCVIIEARYVWSEIKGKLVARLEMVCEIAPGVKRCLDFYDFSRSYALIYNGTVGMQKPLIGRVLEVRMQPGKDGKLYREVVSVS